MVLSQKDNLSRLLKIPALDLVETYARLATVVAQWVVRSLLTPEVHSSNLISDIMEHFKDQLQVRIKEQAGKDTNMVLVDIIL